MVFKAAQTFYVDSAALRGAPQVTITSVTLYVKAKPLPTNNKSGIYYPGMMVQLVPCNSDGTPAIDKTIPNAYSEREYNEIVASADAKAATVFTFKKPVVVPTNQHYAVIVSADGNEDFTLWTCVEGNYYVGTNTITSGATAKNVGDYFEYTSSIEPFAAQVSATTLGPTQNTSVSNWKSLKNTDLKFQVAVAVNVDVEPGSLIANSTNVNSGNNIYGASYILPNRPYEFMVYNKYNYSSAVGDKVEDLAGRLVYQETPVVYGTLTVTAANSIVNASNNINFTTLFDTTATEDPYIAIRDPGSNTTVIRRIVDIQSNTQVMIDGVTGFNSNTATFWVTPVATVGETQDYWYAGNWWDGVTLTQYPQLPTNVLILHDSTANSSIRFSNNYVTSANIAAGGTGYSNTDYVVISCGVSGSLNAVANVVTSNTGVITSLKFSNAGYGMINTTSTSVFNANNTASTGSGLNLNITTGTLIKTEGPDPGAVFSNVVFDNFEAHRLTPSIIMINSVNATIKAYQHFSYYVYPGSENTINKLPTAAKSLLVGGSQITPLNFNDGRLWVIPSRSNEVVFANVAINKMDPITGALSNTDIGNTAGSVTEYVITSNNIFTVPCVVTPDLHIYQYVINNDTTGENKKNGSALAKHISTKVSFDHNRKAEDAIVVVRARRPANTSIKVYAKIHNSADPDSFDAKDWTEMAIISGNDNVTTSLNDPTDVAEFQYGFKDYPNSYATANATVTTTLSSNTVNGGPGSNFNTLLQASDLVKIYSPLFPSNYQIAVVHSVANSSQLTLKTAIANNNVVGTNMQLDLIGRVANGANAEVGLPMQAFNNVLNNNIVRYYNSSMTEFDAYDSLAIKLVLLSNQRNVVPMIEDVQTLGVTT